MNVSSPGLKNPSERLTDGGHRSLVLQRFAGRCVTPSRVPLLLVVMALASVGCAGHAARTQDARNALDAGAPARALSLYNEMLEVESAKQLPPEMEDDNALLVLDRSMVLQQLDEHELSARDLQAADKSIEILDFSRSTADEISRYVFSDDAGPYKSPPYEKLMINTMNMVNYLVRGDLSGGRVEARRFTVMQDYLAQQEDPETALLGPGSYLAGFIFEKSGEPQSALRYYDQALSAGEFPTLTQTIADLSERASYRTPQIEAVLERARKASAAPPVTPDGETAGEGELLVVLSYGRVPAKVAERAPIGLALTYASGAISPADRAKANRLAAQGLVTWVNYPDLEKPKRYMDSPAFVVDGASQRLDGVPIDKLTVKAWNDAKGPVIASAITRMISRVIAGEAANQAGGEGGVGLLLSLATQATLTATDTPDTRSWSTLPARIALGRIKVPAGTHVIELKARGKTLRKQIEIAKGGWAALNLTVLR